MNKVLVSLLLAISIPLCVAADTPISALPSATTAQSTDTIALYQLSGGVYTVKRITIGNLGISIGSGVASLGGQTGAITLSGLTMVGSVLTSTPYSPAQFATASAASPEAGTFTQAYIQNGGKLNIQYSDGTNYYGHITGNVTGSGMGIYSDFGIVTIGFPGVSGNTLRITNVGSLGSVTAGAILGAKAVGGFGEMFVLDELGNETQISPHAADAPPDLYEIGAGADRMERSANPITGLIRWSAKERLETLLFDDMISRLGTQVQSSAAWANAQARLAAVDGASGRSRMVAFVTESFEDYQTRTGIDLYPGATPDAQAAFQALTPSARWAFIQQQAVSASQAAIATWQTQQAAALAAGKLFTTPQPALYVAKAAPAWATP